MTTKPKFDLDNTELLLDGINLAFQEAVTKSFEDMRRAIYRSSKKNSQFTKEMESLELIVDIIEDAYDEHEIESLNDSSNFNIDFTWYRFSDVLFEDYDDEFGGADRVMNDLRVLNHAGIINNLVIDGDADMFSLNFNVPGFDGSELEIFNANYKKLTNLILVFNKFRYRD